jgi:lipopolysaccharide heptosyltransferase II
LARSMPRFLIVRFSSIGDIVLTTPVIRCLKKQMPGCEVHFLTKKNFVNVISGNPYIDKVYAIEKHVDEVTAELRKNKYDVIIDLHNNIRTWSLKRKLGRKSVTFKKLNFEKWLMVNLKINRLPGKHIVDRYFDAVKSLNVKYDGQGLDYYISPQLEVTPEELPTSHRNGFVAIVTGAKHHTKIFPPAKIAELIRKIRYPVVLLGGKEDADRADEIISLCGEEFALMIYNGCGIFSLDQSASIVKQAKAVVTNDTGLMHIAAAFNKNIISVWGNTIPEFGMTPFLSSAFTSASIISEVKGLNCRPCSKIGYAKCPRGHFKCMLDQDVDLMISQLRELVN